MDKHPPSGRRDPLGRVAEFSAANIYFDPAAAAGTTCARLLINGEEKNTFQAGKKYIIYWDNSCPPHECNDGDDVVDLSDLGRAFDKQDNELVNVRRRIRCNDDDNLSRQEREDGDLSDRLDDFTANLEGTKEELKRISRFDPCGGGWIEE